MGKIKNSTPYIFSIILINYYIGTIIATKNSKSLEDIIINIILIIIITIFEILLTNILINIQNNLIMQTELLKKISEQKSEKPVDIMQ